MEQVYHLKKEGHVDLTLACSEGLVNKNLFELGDIKFS